MPPPANFRLAIPLVLNGTTRGQQHKNLKPEASWIEPTDAGDAIALSIQPLDREISGRLLTSMGSSGLQIQPRSESEITPTASIASLPSNTLTPSCEGFGRHTVAIAVNKAHPVKLV